jgi:metal-responsive CopG/Arc/MetJ family transcriptional regulator
MSRPPVIPGNPATACIRIRVTPDVAADLERVAADNQTTRSDVIREAVNEYVLDYRDRLVFAVTSCR